MKKSSQAINRRGGNKVKSLLCFSIIILFLLMSSMSFAQQDTSGLKKGGDTVKVVPDGTEGVELAIRTEETKPKQLPGNEFIGSYSTFRIGMGFIYDFSAPFMSDEFKQQLDSANLIANTKFKVRDFRILGSGVLKTKRLLAWKFAFMYDGNDEAWLLRETGLTIGVPELAGNIFIGRTKEGYSIVKVMNGHSPWGLERAMNIDVIPILADGIKWMGYLPKAGIFWNLGYFNDFMSEGQSFSTFEWQYVARVGWLPINDDKAEKVLHIAANLRYAKPLNEKIALKSRPESNPMPQIINTGTFETNRSHHMGGEIYYRQKQFTIGTEFNSHQFYSDKGEDHKFFGWNFDVTYLFTGAVRPYKTAGSIFGFVPVKKSVFKGGWGEIEGVLRFSVMDLNDKSVLGGKFWRITPMVNWYLTRTLRLELIYGYGELDRFGIKGKVQFFESRFQVTLM